jgi:outer membrane protein assembly factor BamB
MTENRSTTELTRSESRHSFRCLLCILCVSAVTNAAQRVEADERLNHIGVTGEGTGTARRLAAAEKMIADNQLSQGVDEYLRILNESGDDLVPLDARHSISARRLCHQALASSRLPAEALRLYRQHVDPQAKKWWDQAVIAHDVRLLQRIVQDAFCSRFADRALDMLGDLAFERGDFDEAEMWWRLLAPLPVDKAPPNQPATLVFPDPQVDVARVHAKQILLRLLRGDRDGIDATIEAYRKQHGQAMGEFAGRLGNYAETLLLLAQDPNAAPVPELSGWKTFSGDPSRQCVLPDGPPRRFLELAPIPLASPWLDQKLSQEIGLRAPAPTRPFYPVIAGGKVLVADVGHVFAFELSSGKLAGSYDLVDDLKKHQQHLNRDVIPRRGERYTLTVAEDGIFVRMGNQQWVEGDDAPAPASFLVRLDLPPGPDRNLARRWLVASTEAGTMFQGAPVVRDGRAYCTRLRRDGARFTSTLECYNAATGGRHWRQDVCEIRQLAIEESPANHQLLTLAGPNVVYDSQTGAIVALDALTGRRSWAIRYPARGQHTAYTSSPRDLTPCLFVGGKIVAAPADHDRIICLDAASGALLWESPPVEVVHLLGVADGKLIFTTDSSQLALRGIRALDLTTGRMLRSWMQPSSGDGGARAQGRGLLAGRNVYWPTTRGLRVLDQENGQPDAADDYYFSQRFGDRLGNLALGDGCLAIATAEELRIFVPVPGR